jgi:hypothetical protein
MPMLTAWLLQNLRVPGSVVPLVLLALAHGTVAVLAVMATRQAPTRGLLSVDCLWFNALVALLYLLPPPRLVLFPPVASRKRSGASRGASGAVRAGGRS